MGWEAGDALMATAVGWMRLIDYLPSCVLELTVHSLDILAATGSSREAPPGAATLSLRLMADLAVKRDRATVLLGSLTGRSPLPPTFTEPEPAASTDVIPLSHCRIWERNKMCCCPIGR